MREFRFAGEWPIAASPDRVYAVLADIEAYPKWWPVVTTVRRIDARSEEIRRTRLGQRGLLRYLGLPQ